LSYPRVLTSVITVAYKRDNTGWPKKVSQYHESSLNRVKIHHSG